MKSNKIKYTIISIILGLAVGAIILIIAGFNPLEAYFVMLKGVFGKSKYISWTIVRSTPLIITGISLAFAFKTGLFNIGAEGQFIIGALVATLTGYFLKLPPVIHVIVVFVLACGAAACWGGIAGFLKAKFGVNEVISTIMLNWIAFYLNNYAIYWDKFKRPNSEASYKILDSATINVLGEKGKEFISNNPILHDFFKAPVNWGFLIAILIALLARYILNNTTLGYQLKSVGFNKHAAEYGGIDVKKNIIYSMMIAGAISGAAGALRVMGETNQVSILTFMEGNGFDGMAVSLIASNNPVGCIFAGLLFGGLKYGGQKIQPIMGAPSEIINIVIGVIVFFIAMPNLIKMIESLIKNKRGEEIGSTK